MQIPTLSTKVSKYMTTGPLRVELTTTVAIAIQILQKANIRHLPVVQGLKLYGILRYHDLMSFAQNLDDLNTATIESIVDLNPYCVSPETPLYEVATEMTTKKHECAIVLEGDDIVGVFTTTDALRLLNLICEAASKYT